VPARWSRAAAVTATCRCWRLKGRWFNGVELYHDPTAVDARRETHGLPCLPGLCP
jgi:hypothetical protein